MTAVKYIVGTSGGTRFKTLNQLNEYFKSNSVKKAVIILQSGIYKENVSFDMEELMLIGEDRKNTFIVGQVYANMLDSNSNKLGTFNTATFFINSNLFCCSGITFINNAGKVGQAVAFYNNSLDSYYSNCSFLANQDTVFLGGLPTTAQKTGLPHDGIKNYFNPPECVKDYTFAKAYFTDCVLEGDVDFIFGGIQSIFDNCTIISNLREEGYVAAPCTPQYQEFGIIFYESKFISETNEQSVYLARPWRAYGKTAVINCSLGEHIHKDGFHDWDKIENRTTVLFCEYKNHGIGANEGIRPDWIKMLDSSEVKKYFNLIKKEQQNFKFYFK